MKKTNIWVLVISIFLSIVNPNIVFAMDENVSKELFNEDVKTVQVFNSGGRNYNITNKDVTLMAQIVYAESRGEPYDGKVGVAAVILNRMKSGNYPASIEGVITQKNAFSCVVNGKISVVPNESCYNAVFDALQGKDPTNNALFFYNPQTATCGWMQNIRKDHSKAIGNHVFFSINK
ncbi:MAG: cell wall hydrolase [Clostridiaceae bacterium]